MQTGIYYWYGYYSAKRERLDNIKEAGFDSVFFWWGDDYTDFDGPKLILPELARKKGLEVQNVHAPYMTINSIWEDNIAGRETLELLLKCVDECSMLEISTLVTHVTVGTEQPPPYGALGLARFKKICDRAEKKGVDIALENVNFREYLDYIFENVSSDRLKFCYDSGHENCCYPGGDFLQKYGDKLVALHLHDNDGIDDLHLVPFDGTTDFKKISRQLREAGYAGSLTLECVNGLNGEMLDVSEKEYLKLAYNSAKRIESLF